jgi:pyruvate/2-oxoglutarate dehydrogenase complex dihydrolipoamide dehydrogenase (E3) component
MENRKQNENYLAEKLILATGSNPKIWEMMQTYGHAPAQSPIHF